MTHLDAVSVATNTLTNKYPLEGKALCFYGFHCIVSIMLHSQTLKHAAAPKHHPSQSPREVFAPFPTGLWLLFTQQFRVQSLGCDLEDGCSCLSASPPSVHPLCSFEGLQQAHSVQRFYLKLLLSQALYTDFWTAADKAGAGIFHRKA